MVPKLELIHENGFGEWLGVFSPQLSVNVRSLYLLKDGTWAIKSFNKFQAVNTRDAIRYLSATGVKPAELVDLPTDIRQFVKEKLYGHSDAG
jgi:hypothetical protein